MITEKRDHKEAAERAATMAADPKVQAWMRRARRLFGGMPKGAWIYWQESQMCLMVEGPAGEKYTTGSGGSDPAALVAFHDVPKSDAGAW